MNHTIVRNIIGKIMILMAMLMLLPIVVALIYSEGWLNVISFVIPILALSALGFLLNLKKAKDTKMVAREGFIIVGVSWILMSLFGSLPFILSGEIPGFFDAFFEITSGFTTTGASILSANEIESLSHSLLFWRSFSHWIGGMGILVFILAIINESKDGSSVHILRAESPGPQVGKLVSRMKTSSRILYLIYIGLTIIQILLLWVGPDMDLFSSIIHTFGTAGTGGFSMYGDSIASCSHYSQYIIAIFMILFGINFTVYYLILIGNVKEAIKSEEVWLYLGIVFLSVVIIFFSIYKTYNNFADTFRISFFQVASIISTTGYTIVDYNYWPSLALIIIIILMFIGSCAGSTAGGIKVSRIIILSKSSVARVKKMINPRKVETLYINGKATSGEIVSSVQSFFVLYIFIFIFCAILVSIDGKDIITNITASLACISNVGPGLGEVGPSGSYGFFSSFSKIVLSLEMIAGRLELFPVLILFSPKTWTKRF